MIFNFITHHFKKMLLEVPKILDFTKEKCLYYDLNWMLLELNGEFEYEGSFIGFEGSICPA